MATTMVALLGSVSPAQQARDASESPKAQIGKWGFDLAGMDRSVPPGEDFARYASGEWQRKTPIPPDRSRYGTFDLLRDRAEQQVREILESWASRTDLPPETDEAKAARFYRSFLDEERVDQVGRQPLEPELEALRKLASREELVAFMAIRNRRMGRSLFGAAVTDDQKQPDRYTLYLSQGGLGLPDREFYLQERFRPQKERYEQYVAQMLELVGWPEARERAREVVAFETRLAEAHWTRAESRDRDRTYNPRTLAQLAEEAPGFPWGAYFEQAGWEKASRAVVRQVSALPKLVAIYRDTPLPVLQAWQAFHLADEAAPVLSHAFVRAHWEFRTRFLLGAEEERPRWKRAVDAVESALGEAVGRAYVERHFPASSKAQMEELVGYLRQAFARRIEQLDWMGPETKRAALDKLAKMGLKVGYPAKWRDYSKLEVREGDLYGNVLRAAEFEWRRQVERIEQPVDREEWGMTPQTVNAYYSAVKNEIVFPAAILQPPFFDPAADPAVNFGAIGGVIGHEITHGFDDQGRKSDGEGVLRDWWTAEDAQRFEARAAQLGVQYEAYEFPELPGLRLTAKLTMGENIADLGGVWVGLDAYRLFLQGQPAPVLDGFTGEQRFFLGWAQVWRSLYRTDALRQQIVNGPHSPGQIRAFAPLRNVDAWYDAFGVREGQRLYLDPAQRVRIW